MSNSPVEESLTKREFLETLTRTLKPIVNHQLLSRSLRWALYDLKIPASKEYLFELLPAEDDGDFEGYRVKDVTEKKEGKKVQPFNVFVCWLSDFVTRFGRHPAFVQFKAENPSVKIGIIMRFSSEVYKKIPQEKKEVLNNILSGICTEYCSRTEDQGSNVSLLNIVKKYSDEMEKLTGLEPLPAYKTEPEQLTVEVAEAPKAAAEATPNPVVPAVGQQDLGKDSEQLNKKRKIEAAAVVAALSRPASEPEDGSARKKQKTEKGKARSDEMEQKMHTVQEEREKVADKHKEVGRKDVEIDDATIEEKNEKKDKEERRSEKKAKIKEEPRSDKKEKKDKEEPRLEKKEEKDMEEPRLEKKKKIKEEPRSEKKEKKDEERRLEKKEKIKEEPRSEKKEKKDKEERKSEKKEKKDKEERKSEKKERKDKEG